MHAPATAPCPAGWGGIGEPSESSRQQVAAIFAEACCTAGEFNTLRCNWALMVLPRPLDQ